MNKPLILVTGGPAFDKRHKLESKMLNSTYPSAVVSAGGIPIMDLDNSSPNDYVKLCDGAIFTGTHAFTPDNSFDLHPYQVERIKLEAKLMLSFIEKKKPILAICQGMQQLNVALGGDLHINFKYEFGVEHNNTYHKITAVENSLISNLFGKEFYVNSFHNVKVKNLAPTLTATAFSPDGVIEAFEYKNLPVYGFQWHPERMRKDISDTPIGPDTQILFDHFIRLCKN